MNEEIKKSAFCNPNETMNQSNDPQSFLNSQRKGQSDTSCLLIKWSWP